jgi:hypothetical protein
MQDTPLNQTLPIRHYNSDILIHDPCLVGGQTFPKRKIRRETAFVFLLLFVSLILPRERARAGFQR